MSPLPANINAYKKYTLIDNFDKIDLDGYQKQNVSITSYEELTVPEFTSQLIGGDTYELRNFTKPLRYTWGVRPDLLRFLTNRRFYLSTSFSLVYPPQKYLWTEDNYAYSHVMGPKIGMPPLGGIKFVINLLDGLAEKLNNNFKLTDSDISFKHYFVTDGFPLPPHVAFGEIAMGANFGNIDATSYTIPARFGSDNYVDKMLGIEKTFQSLKKMPGAVIEEQRLLINMTNVWGGYGPGPPEAILGDTLTVPVELPADALNKLKIMQSDGGAPPWPRKVVDVFSNLLNRLITFAYYMDSDGAWTRVNHCYFVGEFLEGTVSHFGMEKEDAYINTRNDIFEIKPFYNFYSPGIAQDVPTDIVSHETHLPNIYTFYAYKNNGAKRSYYEALVKLGQNLNMSQTLQFNLYNNKFKPVNYYKLINAIGMGEFAGEGTTAPTYTDSPLLSIYEKAIKFAAEANVDSPFNSPRTPLNRYKKIVFGENLEILKNVKSLKDKFPYGVQIDLPTVHGSPLLKEFKDSGTLNLFATLLGNYSMNDVTGPNADIRNSHKFILKSVDPRHAGLRLSDLQIFDLTDFYQKLDNNSLKLCDDYDCVKFGQGDELMNPAGPDNQQFIASRFKAFQEGFLNEYFKEKLLPFWDMYHGKMCHTEILLFEICKFKVDTMSGEKTLIQSIFIPNILEADVPLTYLDTQVFPAHQYIYEIFAHTLFVGNKYQFIREHSTEASKSIYSEVAGEGTPDSTAKSSNGFLLSLRPTDYVVPGAHGLEAMYKAAQKTINPETGLPFIVTEAPVMNTPYVLIVRAPYYNNQSLGEQETTVVTSKPPLPPDIVFHPYKGIDNKILILLNQNFGRKSMLPIPIFGRDNENIALQFEAQKYERKLSSHLLYESDDGRGRWEIYKITNAPRSYGDFDPIPSRTIDSSVRTGYEDTIRKNVNYYYMARFVDAHGNISNPTTIFYLRMVREEGFSPYLIIKEHNITQALRPVVTVPFKKFIKIKLKDSLRSISGTKSTNANIGYQLDGTTEFKRYKFRITSNKTGKQMDINVRLAKSVEPAWAPKEAMFVDDPQTEGLKALMQNTNLIDMHPSEGPVEEADDGLVCED